ncbi:MULTISPECIES: rRNA maturation RNase YbeY [Propionibacterium]|uniref:rRNA maturation RNase YbeY n=1 Tax=Propionibacterium TaxID=1743 RepID=UPI0005441901|nr:rRNA maturation RNase YbeY [Propionibacterium freudenreichii]AJQ90567.1 putative rRNA maturation factor [Propionibacterium freudenreichii subsp. freudenreichii]MCT2976146.1 rRNA maturation RNase YbeY [Propionibacterium freudenreichii]MCT2980864.1 rRNA maturation RNase YbeY [Propionibacterium freudenreichii]MCT2991685.1 rRNA maturation RNase YbeY [Propionibacterium freudenreichii]MCT2994053.1 rRNA maturation RNase YbeY [Propionibacterium freudenreichii]
MIDLSNESGEEVDTQALIRLARFALDKLRIHPQADLSILLVDVDTMTAYHKQFMNLDGPTDVMSFPMDELREPADGEAPPRGLLGDIVICPAFTSAQAPGNGRTNQEEIEYLLIHGLLHLLGHDHAEPDEKAVMFGLNDRIIADWRAEQGSD